MPMESEPNLWAAPVKLGGELVVVAEVGLSEGLGILVVVELHGVGMGVEVVVVEETDSGGSE